MVKISRPAPEISISNIEPASELTVTGVAAMFKDRTRKGHMARKGRAFYLYCGSKYGPLAEYRGSNSLLVQANGVDCRQPEFRGDLVTSQVEYTVAWPEMAWLE